MLTVTECYKVLGLYLIHLQGGHSICFCKSKRKQRLRRWMAALSSRSLCVFGTGVQPRILSLRCQWKHSQQLSLLQLVCIHLIGCCKVLNMKTLCKEALQTLAHCPHCDVLNLPPFRPPEEEGGSSNWPDNHR